MKKLILSLIIFNLIISHVNAQCYIYLPFIQKSRHSIVNNNINNVPHTLKVANYPEQKKRALLTNSCNLREEITEGDEFNTIKVIIDTQGSTTQINTIMFEWQATNSLFTSPIVLEVLNFQPPGPILQKVLFEGTTFSYNLGSPAIMTLGLSSVTGVLEFLLYFDSTVEVANLSIYVDCNLINYVTPTPYSCGVQPIATPGPGSTTTATNSPPTNTPTTTPTPTVTTTPDHNNSYGQMGNTLSFTDGGVSFAPFPFPTRDPNATPVFDTKLNTPFDTLQGEYTGIQYAGNWFLTFLAYFDSFGFLPWLVLLALGMALVGWLTRFVTGRPSSSGVLDVSGALDVGEATGTISGASGAKKVIKRFGRR